MWCSDCVGKHYANECPLRKPRAPLSPPRGVKYCHICKRHGHHDTDACFYNARVTQPNPSQQQARQAYVAPGVQQPTYAPQVPRPTYQQPYAPKPVFPTANYAQRPVGQTPQNNPPPQPTVPVAHIEYEEAPLGREDYTDDYVEGDSGELIPMYYTVTMQQQRPMGRPAIKCFGCGGPHRKVECPNRMLPGQFVPLCGDCGPGHVVQNCPLRNPPTLKPGPVAPVNLMRVIPNHPGSLCGHSRD